MATIGFVDKPGPGIYLFLAILFVKVQTVAAEETFSLWYIWVCCVFFFIGIAVVLLICKKKQAQQRAIHAQATTTVVHHPPPPPHQQHPPQQQYGGHPPQQQYGGFPAGSDPAYPPGYYPNGNAAPPDPFAKAAYGVQ